LHADNNITAGNINSSTTTTPTTTGKTGMTATLVE